jgi:hypothetical protein
MPMMKESRVRSMPPTSSEKKVKFADMIFTNMSNLRDAV